ncbi:MAG: hypothetical protein FWC89_08700 [Defluviitaleaceae bacterium]|nr:hypothetical protein [Defluviitaleaceae bacterium]
MIEKLLVLLHLQYVELIPDAEYQEFLHELFLQNPNNDLLLELEWTANDYTTTKMLIWEYIYSIGGYTENNIDFDVIGKFLVEQLKKIYHSGMDIHTFGAKVHRLWQTFPFINEREYDEPFFALCYADDPLSWGDEAQSREMYEEMFRFYD